MSIIKKILSLFKTVLAGIWSAILGACIVGDAIMLIDCIKKITNGSGWSVVISFILSVCHVILILGFLRCLGRNAIDAKMWKAYKHTQSVNNNTDNEDKSESSNVDPESPNKK
jgi:uncharacterized protein HemY